MLAGGRRLLNPQVGLLNIRSPWRPRSLEGTVSTPNYQRRASSRYLDFVSPASALCSSLISRLQLLFLFMLSTAQHHHSPLLGLSSTTHKVPEHLLSPQPCQPLPLCTRRNDLPQRCRPKNPLFSSRRLIDLYWVTCLLRPAGLGLFPPRPSSLRS
jgi:hypothetical protein